MVTWLQGIAEVPLATLSFVAGTTFWSMLRLPNFFRSLLTTEANLRMLLVMRYTGHGAEINTESERQHGYPALLYADISSSLQAWLKTRIIAFIAAVVITAISLFVGWHWAVLNTSIFAVSGLQKLHLAAQGNAFRDAGLMMGRLQRWHRFNPEECRRYCTEVNAIYFGRMFEVVSKSSNA